MVSFDVVAGRDYMVSQSGSVTTLCTGKSDLQCKIKETLLISELKPLLNENVGSEKLFLYLFLRVVLTISSINQLVTSSPLFCVFLNVCNI